MSSLISPKASQFSQWNLLIKDDQTNNHCKWFYSPISIRNHTFYFHALHIKHIGCYPMKSAFLIISIAICYKVFFLGTLIPHHQKDIWT